LIVTDIDGNIVLFNATAEFMFGRHRSEVVGRKVEILLPERNRANHVKRREAYDRFSIRPHARTMGIGLRLLGVRSDGREFPADVSLAHMVVPKGVFNLALIRYSVAMAELAAKYTSPLTEPEPMNELPDAER
jgi:PAS domain S-box-containing protein